MSLYWKTRTLISGDYREIEKNVIEYRNGQVFKKRKENDKVYGIIRLHSDEGGLFCLYLKALQGVRYCIDNNLIPVIDMQTKENIFYTKEQRKVHNAWEDFFKQPAGIKWENVKNEKKKIILENPTGPINIYQLMGQREYAEYWRQIRRDYFVYSDEVKQEINKYREQFISAGKVLGVLARGTDYLNPIVNHGGQPSIKEIIENINIRMDKYKCDSIFVATEDQNILSTLQKEYGSKLLYVEQKRYCGMQKDKLGHLEDYVNDAISMNRSYLTALHYLSLCPCFWGGWTTGTMGVFFLADSFETYELWYDSTVLEQYEKKKRDMIELGL